MKTENPSLSITPTLPSFIAFQIGSCVSFYPELVCCLSKSNKNKMLTYIHAYEWITNAQSKKDIEQFLSLFLPRILTVPYSPLHFSGNKDWKRYLGTQLSHTHMYRNK